MHAATLLGSLSDAGTSLANSAPISYQGLWRRRLLEQNGQIDRDTTVYWLQIGCLYADIRIPANRPDCESLSGASAKTLQALAHQQGFAGHLDVDGNVLTWHRWLDYQPPAPVADVGRVHFERDVLIEHGMLANYREEWVRTAIPGSDRIGLVLEAELRADGRERSRRGVFIAMGSAFMIAIAREQDLSVFETNDQSVLTTLEQLVADSNRPETERRALLDCGIDFGRRHGRDWQICLSTLPAREGESLQSVHGSWTDIGGDRYLQHVDTDVRGRIVRRWRVVELGKNFIQLDSATRA